MEALFYSLAISLLLTLLFEVSFALVCGIRTGKGILLTVLVNTLTNPVVVLLHWFFPQVWVTAALEIAAVLVEGGIYKLCSDSIRRPFLYALAINAFSYFCGLGLNKLLTIIL